MLRNTSFATPPKSSPEKLIIRVVLRGAEIDALEEFKETYSIFRNDDAMRFALVNARQAIQSSAATPKNPVGRPRSAWKQEAESIASEVMTIATEDLYTYLHKIGFIEYIYACIWEDNAEWRKKSIYVRETDDGGGTGKKVVKVSVDDDDLFTQAELPDEIRKMYKWKNQNESR